MFWRQLIWKGSQGQNIKACSNEISSSIFPNLGHLHIGNFAGIQIVVNWIQNLCNVTWDTSWINWPYTAFDRTSSARIGGFGEHFGMLKKSSKMTLHRVHCPTTKTAAEKLLWHQDAGSIKEKVYVLVWIMRKHTWEQMASESWCSGAEPGRCQQENVSFEDSMDSTFQPMYCKANGPLRGRRGKRTRGTSLWWRELENRTVLLIVSILHQWSTELRSQIWAARSRSGPYLHSVWVYLSRTINTLKGCMWN